MELLCHSVVDKYTYTREMFYFISVPKSLSVVLKCLIMANFNCNQAPIIVESFHVCVNESDHKFLFLIFFFAAMQTFNVIDV